MSEIRKYIRPLLVTGAASLMMGMSMTTAVHADMSGAVDHSIDVTAVLSKGIVGENSASVKNVGPVLTLKNDEVTVNNGDTFNPESFISYVQDDSGALPALRISDNVDMQNDGVYSVSYQAVGLDGRTVDKDLTVTVKTPQEVLDARAAEAEEKARKEAEEAERKAQEEAQKAAQAAGQMTAQLGGSTPGVTGGANPYPGSWSNCTWGAWQLAYQKLGISLPGWGDAPNWYGNAAASGYSVGQEARANAIAVYAGHVAFVDSVSGNAVEIEEGGYSGRYNHRVVSQEGDGYQPILGYIYL